MSKKATETTLTVVPETSFSHVRKNPTVLDFPSLLAETKADFEELHRLTRMAAERALRIGTRLWCINQTKGALKTFIGQCKGTPGLSQPTLYRFMALAEGFLTEAGYITGKRQLTDPDAVQPLMHEQLELWNSDREDAVGKAVAWINGRGMMEILRDMSQEAAPKPFGGQLGTTSASVSPAQRRALATAAAGKMADDITAWLVTDEYHAKDAHKNRKTLEEVAKMERPALTLSLLNSEALMALAKVFDASQETIKYILLIREGRKVVKRGAKGKGPHS